MKRFNHTYIALVHFLAYGLCLLTFYVLFSLRFQILTYAGSAMAITIIAFSVIYILMCRVYGGCDVGTKKSKPIIYSFLINLIVTDFVSHLFLCILDATITNDHHFEYEAPWLLAIVYVVQMAVIIALTYLGNHVYFLFNKPARCLVVKRPCDSAEALEKRVKKMKRQFRIDRICDLSDPRLLDAIDEADSVMFYNLAVSERTPLVEYCYRKPKDIFYTPEMSDFVAMGSCRVLFDDMSMIHYSVKEPSFEQRIVKRTMDIASSLVGLVIASPVMLLTALAIKLEDGGPVLYRQPRVTYHGKIFNVLKFRSMRVEDGNIHRSATKHDDRITKVGRVIRKFRIDELPQLINILRGDMSLVGPRPEMVENVTRYTKSLPEFAYRQRVKAGLTGMAQIYGKYNTSPEDKLSLDLFYIENFNLILDIKLILRTVLVLLTPDESTEEFDGDTVEKSETKEAVKL